MTTPVLESAGLARPPVQISLSTFKKIDKRAREIAYWSLVGFGVFAPLLGGLAGLVKTLVT